VIVLTACSDLHFYGSSGAMADQPLQVVLDEDFSKTREIVAAVQQLQKQQEDADRKANNELKAHTEDKQKIKAIEAEQFQTQQAVEVEAKSHTLTKEKLEKEERFHAKTRDALQAAKDDVTSMRLQMDAMKVEMEAQRKAFVINVNWAARCTELKTKFDQGCNEYDQLLDKHVKAKSEMDAALRAQEEFRMKNQSALDAYTVVQDEISKQAEELAAKAELSDDVAAKLAELDEFRAKAAHDEMQKKLGSQQALSVLQRSLAKGDEGIKTSAFGGWATLTVTEKKKRRHKDRAMKNALNTIASEGTALMAEFYNYWRSDVEKEKRAALLAASKRLEEASGKAGAGSMAGRQRAIEQLEKQFKGEDFCLMKSCFQGWALGQIARKKKEQNQKKASRMIANSGIALLAEIVGLWNELTEKTRKKNRQQAANMHKAGRMIANSDKALQIDVFQVWWGWIEGIRHERKAKEAGTAKAMRMLANSGQALMNLCFDSWAKLRGDSKKKDAGNKKALRMMADSSQALIITCWQGWSKAKATRNAKNANTAKAVRMINSSNEALTAAVFQSWSGDVRKNRDKNKKMRALERSFGAQDAGRKMVVFNAWQSFAKIEGRKKRAKERSMKTAIKSITGNQDILLCHITLVWARLASGCRVEKLQDASLSMESQLQDAVEQARVAVEEDLVSAQKDVENITGELESMKKRRDEATGKLEGLETHLGNTAWSIEEYDRQISGVTHELEQSRRKAKDIGEELGKVGIFMSAHPPPRKTARSGSGGSGSRPGSRPHSGNKNVDEKLPRIGGSSSRPRSGTKTDGSKSARGVPGERGGSGRREGRPPRNPEDDKDRRYLMDGSGPYTYAEFEEIFAEKGRQNAVKQWDYSAVEEQGLNHGDWI